MRLLISRSWAFKRFKEEKEVHRRNGVMKGKESEHGLLLPLERIGTRRRWRPKKKNRKASWWVRDLRNKRWKGPQALTAI